jgi:hypothetical protein
MNLPAPLFQTFIHLKKKQRTGPEGEALSAAEQFYALDS